MSSRYHAVTEIPRLAVFKPQISNRFRFYSNGVSGSGRSSVKLHDDSSRTIRDFLTPSRVELLDTSLSPYLPALQIPEVHSIPTSLSPGYHFIFFPTSTSELDTLDDGYEKKFAPKHCFKRRVWTQGSLIFDGNRLDDGLMMGEWADCREKVHKVAATKSATDVWIERTMKGVNSLSIAVT